MNTLRYKIADRAAEFDAIHRLNYATFVEEIPQHPHNAPKTLVDRWHDENVYAICLDGSELVGMVAGRCNRPFSLDHKLPGLDDLLPRHARPVEVRLLAVRPSHRRSFVFARLVAQLARHFRPLQVDLAVISGTVRQLHLYRHMGFREFGPQVGSRDARYQPMYLTLASWQQRASLSSFVEPGPEVAQFLPGPVKVLPAVRAAFAEPAISHRSARFNAPMQSVRTSLCDLTGAANAAVLAGSGTLANDAIAAQLSLVRQPGLVISNGEFGERLAAHARGWHVPHQVARSEWGESPGWERLHELVLRRRPAWIWAALSETSTGMTNCPARLLELCDSVGARLCLDAVSAVGLIPVDLRRVWLASAVSGKALAAYPGLAMVFHDGKLAPPGTVPRYVDLATYEQAGGVPYTQSSNLVSALHVALTATNWERQFQRTAAADQVLRTGLASHGLTPLVPDSTATRGIITLPISRAHDSALLGRSVLAAGVALAYQSEYLRRRNWVQVCMMGDFNMQVARRIPSLLAARLGPAFRECSAPGSDEGGLRRPFAATV